jgi:hypothetical protein
VVSQACVLSYKKQIVGNWNNLNSYINK